MKQKGLFFVTKEPGSFKDGHDNYKMLMSKVCAVSVIDKWSTYDVKFPIYEKWSEMLKNYLIQQDTPIGLQSAFMSANEMWAWMLAERAFRTNAI